MASVALSAKAVGSTVKLKVGGTARNFIVVHKGKPSAPTTQAVTAYGC